MASSQKPRNKGTVNPLEVLALGAVTFLFVNSSYHLFFAENLPKLTSKPDSVEVAPSVHGPERNLASSDPCTKESDRQTSKGTSSSQAPCLFPQASSSPASQISPDASLSAPVEN